MKRIDRRTIGLAALAAAALSTASPAKAQTDIQFWHAMAGEMGQRVEKLVSDYNASQTEFHVTAVYKGTYPEVMTGAIAAYRAKQPPHIVQVFEVGTATMMAAQGAIYPVYQLMKDQGVPFDPKAFLPAISAYYSDTAGNMLSFPFNASTPILYYNKDLFRKAGLDPNMPPKTFADLESAAKALQAAGVPCGFTTEWPSYMQFENFSAYHNRPIATEENGLGGLGASLELNGPLQVRHLQNLVNWQKTKLFDYGGRGDTSKPKFFSGECAITVSSASARLGIISNMKAEVGMALLPYYADVAGAPQNSIIGGASLWVMRGQKPADYKGAAGFLAYLARPEVQAWWHQQTGYLPATTAAYELTRQQGFYDKNPGTDVAIKEINLNPPTGNSKGLRLGNFLQVRVVIEEEIENALQGKKTPQQALDAAVARGNELLRQFQRANS